MESNWFTDIPADPNYELPDFATEAREAQEAARILDCPTEALRRLKVGESLYLPQYQRTSQVTGITSPMKRSDGMRFTTCKDPTFGCVKVTRLS